jgi:hypothetical protein
MRMRVHVGGIAIAAPVDTTAMKSKAYADDHSFACTEPYAGIYLKEHMSSSSQGSIMTICQQYLASSLAQGRR